MILSGDLIESGNNDQFDIDPEHTSEISGKSKTPTLDHFSRDITQMAKKGKLDPVIGQ